MPYTKDSVVSPLAKLTAAERNKAAYEKRQLTTLASAVDASQVS